MREVQNSSVGEAGLRERKRAETHARIQSEAVAWTASLLHGPETAAGFLTSGGTESIQCGVLAARERGRAERNIANGRIVVAESAHAAFHKSAHMFDMPIVTAVYDLLKGDEPRAVVSALLSRPLRAEQGSAE